MIRFGIIGCGTIAGTFMSALEQVKDTKLTGVYTPNRSHAEAFAKKYNAKAYADADDLLHSDIDAVYISTPSGLHAEYIVRAADAGKHILAEKPIGITAEQLDAIENACRKNRVKFSAVSQFTFSDDYRRMKEAVDGGTLGKVFLADLIMEYYRSDEYYRSGNWRGTWKLDGGGALMNQGIHGVSLLLGLLGAPKSVTALTRTFVHPIEVEDTALALVEFRNGAVANIEATTSVQPARPRILSLHGTKGTVTLTEDTITEWNIAGAEGTAASGPVRSSASNPTDISFELHRRQIEDFIRAILMDTEPLLGVKEGRLPVELILGIYRSSQTGKTVTF